MQPSESSIRKVDILFNQYSQSHQHPVNKYIQWVCIPLFVFSIMGLVTAIPFPHLDFLGKYNTYISWFSFLLAIMIYLYLKLSPVLSYFMLLITGVLYYFIIQLEYLEKAGGPSLLMVSLGLLSIAILGLVLGNSLEKDKLSLKRYFQLIYVAPIWLLHFMLKQLKINY